MDEIYRHYQVLGLEPGASREQVRQAYQELIKKWHPGLTSRDIRLQGVAQMKLKQINDAYKSALNHLTFDAKPQINAKTPPTNSPVGVQTPESEMNKGSTMTSGKSWSNLN